MQRHPECRVKPARAEHRQCGAEAWLSYGLDLGLIEGDCQHPDIEVQPWVEDELVVFCAPRHPLAERGSATLEELGREAWILREQGSGTRLTFDQAMRHHPAQLNIRLELEHTEAIKRAVESGLGIGCISRLALRDAFRRGSLVAGGDPGAGPAAASSSFIWHRQKYQTAAMREFLELCRDSPPACRRSDEIVLPDIP